MNPTSRLLLVLITLAACQLLGPSIRGQARLVIEDDGSEIELVLPVTFDKVWLRARNAEGGKQGKVRRRTGELTISEDGVEFASKKKIYAAPMDAIEMVSYGKVGSDVDTDWVVMLVNRDGYLERVAFRDGRKFGYGTATPRIHQVLRATAEKFEAGQYRVPPGFQAFDGVQEQCALAIPEQWSSFARSSLQVDGRMRWGELIFSEAMITDHAIRFEEIGPSFFLDRWEATRGQTCDHISDQGGRALMTRVESDPMLGEGYEILAAPKMDKTRLGQCDARRVVARSRATADGGEWVLDLRAAADGETLYLFGMRTRVEDYKQLQEVFEQSAASIKFAVAQE